MQVAAQFKKGYLAFGDLKNSLGSPVYNPALNTLDPLSMLPFGAAWQPEPEVFWESASLRQLRSEATAESINARNPEFREQCNQTFRR